MSFFLSFLFTLMPISFISGDSLPYNGVKDAEFFHHNRKDNGTPLPYNFARDITLSGPDNEDDGTPFPYDLVRDIKPTDELQKID